MLTGKRLQYLADLLPENVSWGDPLNALMLDQILAAHSAGAQPKGAGMQAQMIASRICSALEADKDDGYDLEAGLFGKALSALIRELAAMSLSAGAQEPIGYLPAYELERLQSGHNANLRSAKFGPSQLDGDVAVYMAQPQPITDAARDAIESARLVLGAGLAKDISGNGVKAFVTSISAAERLSVALAEIERLDRAKGK